jgi:hypothetical protein
METTTVHARIGLSLAGGHLFVLSCDQAQALVDTDSAVAREGVRWRGMGGGRGTLILIQPDHIRRILEGLGLRPASQWWQDPPGIESAGGDGGDLAVAVAIPLPRGGCFRPSPALTARVVASDPAMREANERLRAAGEGGVLQVPQTQVCAVCDRIGLRPVEQWYAHNGGG